LGAEEVVLEVAGVRRAFAVARYGDAVYVGNTLVEPLSRFPDAAVEQAPGSLVAPMPGTVVRVADGVRVGARVVVGQPLLWLEAMKMEHRVSAPVAGTVTVLHAVPGEQVGVGSLLAVVREE
jgi:propionyl-CoA carboxylase alpha chain